MSQFSTDALPPGNALFLTITAVCRNFKVESISQGIENMAIVERESQHTEKSENQVRLEARVRKEQKEKIERAAAIKGLTLSDFVRNSLDEAATKVIQDHEVIRLSAADSENFVNSLTRPAKEPNLETLEATKLYKKLLAGS